MGCATSLGNPGSSTGDGAKKHKIHATFLQDRTYFDVFAVWCEIELLFCIRGTKVKNQSEILHSLIFISNIFRQSNKDF